MGFFVHRAERADRLVDGLAALLREPPDDPFAFELVLVPARGVERWLSQRLSHLLGNADGADDGVCAGVEFRSPASLTAEILGTREEDPWRAETLMWPVLRVIDRSLDEPWADVLAQHLGHRMVGEEAELRRGRRLALARRMARLFSSYAVQRPVMLADWEAGGDASYPGTALAEDLRWQPELWRRVVAEVGQPSPVTRHSSALAALRAGRAELTLPSRLSLFGHTRMARTEVELLVALGASSDVHLWITHPSDVLWRAQVAGDGWRAEDRSHLAIQNPLLASMSRDVRETEQLLRAASTSAAGDAAAWADDFSPVTDRSDTLLAAIQSDVAADRAPAGGAPVDASVQVHACHGPARQVEVLREVLLAKLADDPTLAPRDIVVMCPDIDAYAPLINGVFGLGDAVFGGHPGQRLPVLLADRSPTQTNPLLGVLSKVLDLADGRVEASRVLDLLADPALRRRFGFSEADLEQITDWVGRSGIRWGFNADSRSRFGMSSFTQNTWQFGLDRVLAGVALSDDSGIWLGPTLPMDDVSTSDISLVGRFAEVIERLRDFTDRLAGAHPLAEWLELLRGGVERLADVPRGEEWQLAQLNRELAGFAVAGQAPDGADPELRLPDIKAMLHGQLAGRPTRANFRTGAVTVCTMTPMRSVPHRVVCLLGLDDGVFPRAGSTDGDDVLSRDPRTGEWDLRSQDRQLFLEAIMSATDSLVITFTGFDESTGAERPPSVPLREFLDVADATATGGSVLREHRSQAFHPDYFDPVAPFSFDPGASTAARAAIGARTPAPELVDLRLPAPPPSDIELSTLIAMVTNPVAGFLRHRLMIDVAQSRDEQSADEPSDRIPVDPVGLEQWQIGERMLRAVISGVDPTHALHAEWRRGSMPPGRFGWQTIQRMLGDLKPLVDLHAESIGQLAPSAQDVEIELPDGRRVVGTVSDVYANRLVRVTFSRLGAKQRLSTWVELVALAASRPGNWVARSIARGPRQGKATAQPLGSVSYATPAGPHEVLRELVELHDLAMTRVLPLLPKTGFAFAREVARGKRWDDYWMLRDVRDEFGPESRKAEPVRAWGSPPTWEQLTAEGGEFHLFGELATRLWTPVLAAEVSGGRR